MYCPVRMEARLGEGVRWVKTLDEVPSDAPLLLVNQNRVVTAGSTNAL